MSTTIGATCIKKSSRRFRVLKRSFYIESSKSLFRHETFKYFLLTHVSGMFKMNKEVIFLTYPDTFVGRGEVVLLCIV